MINKEQALALVESTVNGRDVSNFNTHVKGITFTLLRNGDEIHEFGLSVQASEYHYCLPRCNDEFYTHVEIGFPNFLFSDSFIKQYAEDVESPTDTVYGYVPIEELAEELARFASNFIG